ncbi:MAG: CPBP family intramembrane glutamic endopeptidase [Bdellovibrionia bacterium]
MKKLLIYEALLGAAGFGFAVLFGFWTDPPWFGPGVWLNAALGSLPPLAFAAFATSSFAIKRSPMRRIFEMFSRSEVGNFIRTTSWPLFLVVSITAGIAEELLFRGILQPYSGNLLGSVVFGILHALTPGYFVIATAMSLYLGWIYEWCGGFLFVPAAIHALYDFVALLLYKRRLRTGI